MSRDRIFLSRDKSVDLTGVLSCRATLFERLRHNLLSLRQVQLACDVTSLTIAFEIHRWDWRSIKQPCPRYIIILLIKIESDGIVYYFGKLLHIING